jgi:HEAT repeat protein
MGKLGTAEFRYLEMDILSFFRPSPEQKIRKLRKKVKEPHGDASVRQNAAQRLFEMGTEASLRALLDRFTITVSPSVQDETEKQEVFSSLVSLGKRAVPPLISFLKNERAVYWPARALQQILDEEETAEQFSELLQFHWENPPATAYPKAQIIRSLEGIESERLLKTVKLFLKDEDDDVRLASIEYLLDQSEESSRESILKCYLNSEDRPRIRVQILDHLSARGWSVKGFRPAVEESLPEGYALTREGKVRKVGI